MVNIIYIYSMYIALNFKKSKYDVIFEIVNGVEIKFNINIQLNCFQILVITLNRLFFKNKSMIIN